MVHKKVKLINKQADGYIIPLGPVNLVAAVSDTGMVSCGAFDIAALEKYNYPAARVRAASGGAIVTIDDLLSGIVKDANKMASERGIKLGMSAKEALELM